LTGVESSPPEQTFPEKIEPLRDSLRHYGKERTLATLEKQVAITAEPDEELAMLILAIPIDWPLSEPLLAWLRKNRGHRWRERAIGEIIATLLS
jgi:hypothetical protein